MREVVPQIPDPSDAELETAMANATQAAYEKGVAEMRVNTQTPEQATRDDNVAAEAMLRELENATKTVVGEEMGKILKFEPRPEITPDGSFDDLRKELGNKPMTPAEEAAALQSQAERRAQG